MPTPGASVRLRRLKRRFGIGAPRLAITTHIAWYWRALALFVFAVLLLSVAIGSYELLHGQEVAQAREAVDEVRSLRNHVRELDAELTKLRSAAGVGENSLQMERATQRHLTGQVKSLESENAALKEDLAFFEGLTQAPEVPQEEVRIDRFRVERGRTAEEIRYRMLVVNSSGIGRQGKVFRGELQLLVNVRQGNKAEVLFPLASVSEKAKTLLEVKSFHRLEGEFVVPPGADVVAVEARVVQDGVVRARQSVNL